MVVFHFSVAANCLFYLAVFFGIPIFLVMLAAGLQLQRAALIVFCIERTVFCVLFAVVFGARRIL